MQIDIEQSDDDVVTVTIGTVTVDIYESLRGTNRVMVEIDGGYGNDLNVVLFDKYIHGGPCWD